MAGWLDFVRATKSPDLAVVLMEDLGAVAGVLVALVGVGLSALTTDGLWDGLASLVIGGMLIGIAVLLGPEAEVAGPSPHPAGLRVDNRPGGVCRPAGSGRWRS